MNLQFYKYQGTGNDFVMLDNRKGNLSLSQEQIAKICHRNFGVGADGLILLELNSEEDFVMKYYNSDGNESSMCGNGGRCFVRFMFDLNLIQKNVKFLAVDGWHEGEVMQDAIRLKMGDVSEIKQGENYIFLNTGSPHHIAFCDAIDNLNVKQEGATIRYSDLYGSAGSNVNFVEKGTISPVRMRTYERGVEDETLSCGTGVTAVALAMHFLDKTKETRVPIETQGGNLEVTFTPTANGYTDIYLSGAANKVFTGNIEI